MKTLVLATATTALGLCQGFINPLTPHLQPRARYGRQNVLTMENFDLPLGESAQESVPREVLGEQNYQRFVSSYKPDSLMLGGPQYPLIRRISELKLLSLTAEAGILSRLEELGLKLSDLEKLLPIADELNLLPLAEANKQLLLQVLAPIAIEQAPVLIPILVGVLRAPPALFTALGIFALAAEAAVVATSGNVAVDVLAGLLLLPLAALGLGAGTVLSTGIQVPASSGKSISQIRAETGVRGSPVKIAARPAGGAVKALKPVAAKPLASAASAVKSTAASTPAFRRQRTQRRTGPLPLKPKSGRTPSGPSFTAPRVPPKTAASIQSGLRTAQSAAKKTAPKITAAPKVIPSKAASSAKSTIGSAQSAVKKAAPKVSASTKLLPSKAASSVKSTVSSAQSTAKRAAPKLQAAPKKAASTVRQVASPAASKIQTASKPAVSAAKQTAARSKVAAGKAASSAKVQAASAVKPAQQAARSTASTVQKTARAPLSARPVAARSGSLSAIPKAIKK